MSEPEPELLIQKDAVYIPVSEELLMDFGVIPDTRPPRPPVPWHRRLRWKLSAARTRAAEVAYRLISGTDVPERDDW